MGRPWCDGLTRVNVARSDQPKPVTFVYPFYENGGFLRTQIDGWQQYPADLRTYVRAIVVDDGSPSPAADVLRTVTDYPFPIRLFRIDVDVRWNWLAARNIGAHHAQDGWLLLTDMDHVVPAETLSAIIFGRHDPKCVYAFSRREHTGVELLPHSASFLMTREMFWRIGGYDEALSGFYGTDGDYRRRLVKVAPIRILTDVLVRHEYVGDSSTSTYLRKQPEDAGKRAIIEARGRNWRPKTLSFDYHEVTV